jgi:hypothetical protein
MLLLVTGYLFAAGSPRVTESFSADVALYEHYAHAALDSPLLHLMPKEYPALALAVFMPPLALPITYALGFSLFAAVGGVALVLSSDGFPEYPGWSRRACYYLVIGTVSIVFARYDVFPALAAVLAVEAARRERWGRAWIWAVLGGLLKLFPFVLLPGFLLIEHAHTGKWALRRLWVLCVPVGLLTVGQLVLAPTSILSAARFQLDRGFELSSLQGSLAFLLDPLHVHWINGFGAVELAGPDHLVVTVVVMSVAAVSLVTLGVLAGIGRLSVVAISLAVLSVAVLTDKSFGPQYLVWIAPFWAYWPFRRGWVVAALLTTLVFPVLYGGPDLIGPGLYLPTAVAAVRNAVLVVATVAWLLDELRINRNQVTSFDEAESSRDVAPPLALPTPTI